MTSSAWRAVLDCTGRVNGVLACPVEPETDEFAGSNVKHGFFEENPGF